MQPPDVSLSDGSKPDRSDTRPLYAIKRETPILDSNDKYTNWLILKFNLIAKWARFTPERLKKLIIRDEITEQEKEILI